VVVIPLGTGLRPLLLSPADPTRVIVRLLELVIAATTPMLVIVLTTLPAPKLNFTKILPAPSIVGAILTLPTISSTIDLFLATV
jgi:hypothetical protein